MGWAFPTLDSILLDPQHSVITNYQRRNDVTTSLLSPRAKRGMMAEIKKEKFIKHVSVQVILDCRELIFKESQIRCTFQACVLESSVAFGH